MLYVRTTVLTAVVAATTFVIGATHVAAQQGSGTLSARFITPTPACLPSGTAPVSTPRCDGLQTSSISWGDPGNFGIGQSSFVFQARPFTNVPLGQTFVLGTLTYFNGTIFVGTEITDIVLQITSASATPAFNQILGLPLRIVQTTNAGVDPVADADFLYFSDALQFGSFRVFEGQSATVEILGRFNSLDNMGFGRITNESVPGAGFLNPSLDPSPTTVPEPSTVALCALGLLGLFAAKRRAATKSNA